MIHGFNSHRRRDATVTGSEALIDASCETVFDVVVRRIVQQKFFFQCLTMATAIVPNLPVLVAGPEDGVYTLFLRAFSP